jgi:predicted nucleotidyltransferase
MSILKKDEAKEDSDIDILIETTPEFLQINKGFSAFVKLDEIKSKLKESNINAFNCNNRTI